MDDVVIGDGEGNVAVFHVGKEANRAGFARASTADAVSDARRGMVRLLDGTGLAKDLGFALAGLKRTPHHLNVEPGCDAKAETRMSNRLSLG